MAYCSNCGSTYVEGATFCANCGAKTNPNVVGGVTAVPTGRQLHCPKCKSVRFTPIVESSINGAVTTYSKRGRVSGTRISKIHRNYWLCSHCGMKFRNIQNLEEELGTVEKNTKSYLVAAVIFVILSTIMTISVISDPLGLLLLGVPICVLWGLSFAFIVLYFTNKSSAKKMTGELDWLEANCFN